MEWDTQTLKISCLACLTAMHLIPMRMEFGCVMDVKGLQHGVHIQTYCS
jgi:hypothetical protein